jgi:DNA-binding protein HU-beta
MNKQELIDSIAEKCGMTKADCTKVVNAFQETIQGAIKAGDGVQLVGFMSLTIKTRKQRNSVNPITQAKMVIPEKQVVKITPGKSLVEQLTPVAKKAPAAKKK